MLKALLGVLAALVTAGAVQAQPPVWVVRDRDSELVLFGSVHVLPPGLDWRPKALNAALAGADDIWFELPIDAATQTRTAQLASQLGVLPPGQSLFKMLKPREARRLSEVAQQYGASPVLLDHLQPWFAEVALSGAEFRKAGAEGSDGVEQTLSAAVPPGAQRRAFETPEQQIGLLADEPRDEQIASLTQTVRDMQDKPDEYRILVRAWMSGDLAALDREALAPLRKTSPTLFRRLITERNARWTTVLDQRLKGHGRTVVVVGVGHLIGPDGVPARLRALGYQVEGP